MSDLMTQRIAVLTADRLAETPDEGQLVWDRELEQLFCGDGSTAGGIKVTADDGFVPQYKTVAASSSATETVYWRPKTSGNTLRVTVAAGSGSYTKPVVLSRETRADGAGSGDAVAEGTVFDLSILFTTTSASRVIEIRENSAVGDLLDTFNSDTEGTYTAIARYVYTGSAWVKLFSQIHTA